MPPITSASSAAHSEYVKAQRAGQKNYRECLAAGQHPYLQVLDDVLQITAIEKTESLGLVDIPTDRIVGTKTLGRQRAFANNFMPLLDPLTEFGAKWIALCNAQMHEGIRDPIRAYEFMNRFYVQEGNKRVSVLKHFGSPSIMGYVTRLIPARTDTPENRLYYEFLDFYRATGVNCLWFSRPGSFIRLQEAAGHKVGEEWPKEERVLLVSLYRRFTDAYREVGGESLHISVSDALLRFIEVYGYDRVRDAGVEELHRGLDKMWKELLAVNEPDAVRLSMEPSETAVPLLDKILRNTPEHLQVAFLYEKTPATSAWTYAHEMGRGELADALGKRVTTRTYENVQVGEDDEAVLEKAIAEGAQVVFTTTPKLMAASLRAAVQHPEVKILNCSLSINHPDIRTYYGRIHEAKFLVGAIAGALADDNRIGYVASYPTRGMTAGINAFALGASMVNPRVRIYLEWSSVKDAAAIDAAFAARGVQVISNLDMQPPIESSPRFGLYRLEDGQPHNYAMPYWSWGSFYTRIIESIFDGRWKSDAEGENAHAINYWWGMAAGMVDVVCSRSLPPDTARLVELLRTAICHSDFEPLSGVLVGQNGTLHGKEGVRLTPEEIINMDWLADNIEGSLPAFDELIEEAKPLVRLQGVGKETL